MACVSFRTMSENMDNIKPAENFQLGTLCHGGRGPADKESISREMMCSIVDAILGPVPTHVQILPWHRWGAMLFSFRYLIEEDRGVVWGQIIDNFGIHSACVLRNGRILFTAASGFYEATPKQFAERDGQMSRPLLQKNNCGLVFRSQMHIEPLGSDKILCVRAIVKYPRNRIHSTRNVIYNMSDGTLTIMHHRKIHAFSYTVRCTPMHDGNVLITNIEFSGTNDSVTPNCFILSHATLKFKPRAAMGHPRWDYGSCTTITGTIFTCGGHRFTEIGSSRASCVCEEYDPAADKWTTLPPLEYACSNTQCITLPDGKILVVADAYNRVADPWPEPQSGFCGVYDISMGGVFTLRAIPGRWSSTFIMVACDDTE